MAETVVKKISYGLFKDEWPDIGVRLTLGYDYDNRDFYAVAEYITDEAGNDEGAETYFGGDGDTPKDAIRALIKDAGRYAKSSSILSAFSSLLDELERGMPRR